jgi:hypothetical protein
MGNWCLSRGKKQRPENRGQKTEKIFFCLLLYVFCLLSKMGHCLAFGGKTFDGVIDFKNRDISFNLDLQEKGRLALTATSNAGAYSISLALKHIKLGKSEVSTDFYAAGTIVSVNNGGVGYKQSGVLGKSLSGRAWTQNTILNFRPLKEFSVDYEIGDSGITITLFSWADFSLKGEIKKGAQGGLYYDLSLTVKDMPLSDFAGLLGVNLESIELSGVVNGEIIIKGPHNTVEIEAKLTARDGSISLLKFSSISLEAQGFWPVLRIVKAKVNDADGLVYEPQGKFNLKELSDFTSSAHSIMVNSANNSLRLQDWILRRKMVSDGYDWLEAEFPLKKNQALKLRIKGEEEILEWEKAVKF